MAFFADVQPIVSSKLTGIINFLSCRRPGAIENSHKLSGIYLVCIQKLAALIVLPFNRDVRHLGSPSFLSIVPAQQDV